MASSNQRPRPQTRQPITDFDLRDAHRQSTNQQQSEESSQKQ